jgi:L-idonate 5-dehydrogenase
LELGADRVINVAEAADQLGAYATNKGYFDVQFRGVRQRTGGPLGLEVLKPRGILVQLGLGGDVSIPQNMVVAKEIEMRGTFRFHEEFGLAVDLINQKRVDLTSLLTGVFGLDEAMHAFEVAGDRSRSYEGYAQFLKSISTCLEKWRCHRVSLAFTPPDHLPQRANPIPLLPEENDAPA